MAGEVGHIRLEKKGPVGYGKEGSFEGFCSGGGIALQAEEALQKERDNAQKYLDIAGVIIVIINTDQQWH